MGDIAFASETVERLQTDIQPLIELHWEEIARNKDAIKLNPDFSFYQLLESSGRLHCLSARKDNKLIGYAISMIAPHPHYKDFIFATNDILYIHPEYRKGRTGYQLIKEMIKHYKAAGSAMIHIHMKTDLDFSPLLIKLGFIQIESNWELRII